jgi:phosphoribosylformylglycinamidine (FGAM) synthase PurS component
MPKSMKQLLRISCVVLLVFASCATNTVVKDYAAVALDKTIVDVPYFSNTNIDYVYKANITVFGNDLTGIFIAKKIDDTRHRVVFTTEFGNKLLDFEISENNFIVNSIVSELDRKMLINTLVSDFRLLLRSQYKIKEQFESKEEKVYVSENGKKLDYLFISKLDNTLSKIVEASKRKEKINLFFTVENNIFATNIIFEHKTIPLKIELNYFKEQAN